MKIILSKEKTNMSREDLVHLIDSILLHYNKNESEVPKKLKKAIESLPSKYIVEDKMSEVEVEMLHKIVQNIWKEITGQNIDNIKLEHVDENKEILSGNYWMLPGGMLLGGFNHFSVAKKHKGMFCSILDLDAWAFEKFIASDPQRLIYYVISKGGIRMNVDKENSIVICQTNEDSFSWTRNKLLKMYHKTKIIKIIDLKVKYNGWKSGIIMVIK